MLVVAACETPTVVPTQHLDTTGILLVAPGEVVQARPPSEEHAQAFSDAWMLAESSDDLGYPWIDPPTGQLVLSAATPRGRERLEELTIGVPFAIREVKHGAKQLREIQDAATFLRAEGVPGAELVYGVSPDHRDNRTLIFISAMSRPLLDALAQRFPPTALAITVEAIGAAGFGPVKPTPGPIALRTADSAAPSLCPGERIEGTLTAHDETGLGLFDASGIVVAAIVWPQGWSASPSIAGSLLVDPSGNVVARTGDIVRVDAIGIEPGTWLVCGNVVGLSGG